MHLNRPESVDHFYHYKKIENLTIELTTLQLCVKDQLFIIKKQLEEVGKIQNQHNSSGPAEPGGLGALAPPLPPLLFWKEVIFFN